MLHALNTHYLKLYKLISDWGVKLYHKLTIHNYMFPLMDGQTIIWYTYVLQAESRQLRMFGSSLNYAC